MVKRTHDLLLREGNRDALLLQLSSSAEFGATAEADVLRERQREMIRTINARTLVVWGGRDSWITTAAAEGFVRDLPRAELKIFDELGHIPMEQDPIRTAQAAATFLNAV